MRAPSRLYGPATLTNATATKYTTPAVTLAVVRHVHVSNPTGGAVTFTMSVGADAAGTRLFDAYSIAAGAVLDFWTYTTLQPAEIIAANASANSSLVITIDGDLITLG